MSDTRRRIGARIRELRRAMRYTQEQLGERAALSYKFVGEVERGIGNPTVDTLERMAHALGVELVDLIADPHDRPPDPLAYSDVLVVREARDALEQFLSRAQRRSRKGRRGK